jgi:hypothetical protein
MDSFTPAPAPPRIYYYHWLAYWRWVAAIGALLLVSLASLALWPPLGAGLLAFCLTLGAALYRWRSWHTLTFLPDGRLVRRRGLGGYTHDMITLFGVITPSQIPAVGRLLDVGSVHLGIPGPDIHIRHIGDFEAFCRDMCSSQSADEGGNQQQTVQVVFVWPQGPGNNGEPQAVRQPPEIAAPRTEPPEFLVTVEPMYNQESRWHG